MELTITSVLRRAVKTISNNLGFYAAITLLFFIFSASFEILAHALKSQRLLVALLFALLGIAVYAKQAVVVHRSIILGEAGQWDKVFAWKMQDNHYLLSIIAVGLMYALLGFGVTLAFIPLQFIAGVVSAEAEFYMIWPMLIVHFLIFGMVFSAICLMLPSIALGKFLSVQYAFDLVQPVFYQVFVLMAVLPAITAYLFTEVLAVNSLLLNLLVNLIYHLVLVFEITILSHTYDLLTGHHEPADEDHKMA